MNPQRLEYRFANILQGWRSYVMAFLWRYGDLCEKDRAALHFYQTETAGTACAALNTRRSTFTPEIILRYSACLREILQYQPFIRLLPSFVALETPRILYIPEPILILLAMDVTGEPFTTVHTLTSDTRQIHTLLFYHFSPPRPLLHNMETCIEKASSMLTSFSPYANSLTSKSLELADTIKGFAGEMPSLALEAVSGWKAFTNAPHWSLYPANQALIWGTQKYIESFGDTEQYVYERTRLLTSVKDKRPFPQVGLVSPKSGLQLPKLMISLLPALRAF